MIALLGLALAGPPATDPLIYTVVDAIYGRHLPPEAVCIERPLFPDGLELDAVAVGVQRGALGCTLLGVMVDGTFQQDLDKATAKAFPEPAWTGADRGSQARWLTEWTTRVVLAFEQLDPGAAASKATDGGWVVETTGYRRTEDRLVAEKTTQRIHWTADRALADREVTVQGRSRLSFNARETRLDGVSAEGVHAGLESIGRRIGSCVEQAWSDNLAIQGRIRLQWSVAGGQAHKIAVVAQDDDGSGLAQCYARAVGTATFSPSLAGQVVWAFNLVQTPLD